MWNYENTNKYCSILNKKNKMQRVQVDGFVRIIQ